MIVNVDLMLKAQQWEITKGHMRAMVNMQGSYSSSDERQKEKYKKLGGMVEKFIKAVEDQGFEE